MFGISSKGDWKSTSDFLTRMTKGNIYSELNRYGEMGVAALAAATPVETGLTSQSWKYRIVKDRNRIGIEWYNTNKVNGTPVAILIQYGHGTGTGGYVHGRDFINPTMHPIFDKIADEIWKKVTA